MLLSKHCWNHSIMIPPYLIFVTGTTGGACGEISPHDRCLCTEILHMKNCQLEKCLHMLNMEKNLSCGDIFPHENVETNLFCRNFCCFFCLLRCFVAKSILSRFTGFCVLHWIKNCACGENRKNMRYGCIHGWYTTVTVFMESWYLGIMLSIQQWMVLMKPQ